MSDADAVSYRLQGPVTFDNLAELRAQGEAAIAAADGRAVVDLSGLESGNSVAVALMMAWFRAAELHDKAIAFAGVPDELSRIIALSGMADVLPLATDEHRGSEAVS